MNIIYVFAIILTVAAFALGSPAAQCEGENFEGLQERITVIPCQKRKCTLPKGQNITVIFKFNPKHPVKTLRNNVNAMIAGLPLPFVGVDGTDACNNIFFAEDNTPAHCPLEAGKEYVYTNVFFIYDFYPTVGLRVHWSLDDRKTKVICFEIPAAIK